HLRPQKAMRIRDNADAHGCSIRRPMRLLCDTPREWVELALERFDEVLVDHAHCEKKAAAQALSMLAAFPMVAGLPRAMARLAREEVRGVRGAARADGSRGGGADRRAAVTAGDSLTAARPWRRSPARRASGIFASARGGWRGSGVARIRRDPASPVARGRSARAG